MNVLFVTNIPSPYRIDFFSELAKYCNLTIFFEGRRSKKRASTFNWNDDSISSFKHYFFSELFNEKAILFSLIKKVIFGRYDKIIICTYNTRTQSILIILLKILKIEYYFETDGGYVSLKESKLKSSVKKMLFSGAKGYFSTGVESDKYLIHYGAEEAKLIRYTFTSLFKCDIIPKVLTKEQKSKNKRELGIPYKKIVIAVGRFVPIKGFDVLLKSCKYFSEDVGVYFIGGQPMEEYIEIQNQLNLKNINYVGFQTKLDLDKWFLAADLLVLPSRGDVWGLVINEAMAKGLPVVTTNKCIAGLELIPNKECIFPVDNYKILGEIINKIINNEDYSNRLSNLNLARVKNITFENMAIDHLKEFSK
ncbi:D-inositol 3-phosphate glycosyltransferase [Mariniflexile rhizosphaerae]|uniref:glycosyltransferase family 4 protein n=1 Tax=unclassified Mariniflexile TaxID=2643887 RepID=UPI000E33181F|nr:glycosyltransferase family 4 protein [Mariniflexile sp. TRM1-10]AXP80584.1 D-inositol 3-phosphate glycosyltransferase [Mariniflexile sp. TRM1-10]